MERVECVEKLLLSRFLAGHELDVVDQENIHTSEFIAEFLHFVVTDAVDHLVHELLGGIEADARRAVDAEYMIADGGQKVRLAETYATVNEKGVVAGGRFVGHRLGRGMGELVTRAADKGIKGIPGIPVSL